MWSITALDLDRWSATTAARTALPVLVRRLLHGVRTPLKAIDFPAFEAVDRPGWDGRLDLDEASSSWAPAGASFWELSCRADIARKATSDLTKRTAAMPAELRRQATFVFVTPRRWEGRAVWEAAARARGDWRDVRAYDAETLSQWLETVPAATLWLQSQLGRSIDDLCPPDDLWEIWAGATQPRLTFDIFAEAYEESRSALQAFFAVPPERALPVAADTRSEAAAFAAGALLFGADARVAHNCVVARTESGLQRLRREAELPIVIIADRRLEAVLGDLPQRTWVLVATDRASLDEEPSLSVKPLTWEAFHRTVRALALPPERAAALDDEAGRRVTLIRRRLSSIPEVRRPLWADLPDLTPTLAGLALAGGWYWEKAGDKEVLCAITGESEAQVERAIHRLATLEDPPIFTVAGAGGVISRHDAFPVLRHALTRGLAARFYDTCRSVLLAPDPTLELEPDKRWMANIYGKERPHSGRLRGQLTASLAFLSSTKISLIEGFDPRQAAENLVADLFDDEGAWVRLRDVLPELAEAAPRAFLDAAAKCLPFEVEDRGLWALVKPMDNSGFGESMRVKLVWALERLAGDPAHFTRVADTLAALSERPLTDNLVTKPHASLIAMLNPRLAQDASAAHLQGRVLRSLAKRRPDVAWTVALALVDARLGGGPGLQSCDMIRSSGEVYSDGPANAREAAFEIALGRELNAQEALALIEKSPCFDGPDLARLWTRIAEWQATASEQERAAAREAVRRSALWRERRRGKGFQIEPDPRAREIFDLLRAPGTAGQYAWLFQSAHVHHGSDELWDEKLDWRVREERIAAERKAAIQALWAEGGLDSVTGFARGVGSPGTVGAIAGQKIAELDLVAVAALHEAAADWPERRDFIAGVIAGLGTEREARLAALEAAWRDRPEALLEILLICPPGAAIWDCVERLPEALRNDYWRRLTRRTYREAPEEIARACRQFLGVGRPRAALNQTLDAAKTLDTQLLVDVLLGVAQVAGPDEDGLVDPHAVEEILSALDTRADADRNTRLRLDFIYAEALDHTARGMAALSEELAANPDVFALAVRNYYGRDDGTEGAVDEGDVEAALRAAALWMHVLENCRLSPGADADGAIDATRLQAWMSAAVELLAADGRLDRGLYKIGVLLGRLRREVEGVWPPLDVAAVLEPFANEAFRSGLEIGVLNSRGVHSRGHLAGGAPERVLAEKFRSWRRRLEPDFPSLAQAFEAVASTYDLHALRHDEESRLERLAVR